MRAIVLEKFGGLDSLVYWDIPGSSAGHVVIAIKTFGSVSTMPRCICGGEMG